MFSPSLKFKCSAVGHLSSVCVHYVLPILENSCITCYCYLLMFVSNADKRVQTTIHSEVVRERDCEQRAVPAKLTHRAAI